MVGALHGKHPLGFSQNPLGYRVLCVSFTGDWKRRLREGKPLAQGHTARKQCAGTHAGLPASLCWSVLCYQPLQPIHVTGRKTGATRENKTWVSVIAHLSTAPCGFQITFVLFSSFYSLENLKDHQGLCCWPHVADVETECGQEGRPQPTFLWKANKDEWKYRDTCATQSPLRQCWFVLLRVRSRPREGCGDRMPPEGLGYATLSSCLFSKETLYPLVVSPHLLLPPGPGNH